MDSILRTSRRKTLTISAQAVAAGSFRSEHRLKVHLESTCRLLGKSWRRRVTFNDQRRQRDKLQSLEWNKVSQLSWWVLYLWIDLLQQRALRGKEPGGRGAGQRTLDHRRSLTWQEAEKKTKDKKKEREREEEREQIKKVGFSRSGQRQAQSDSHTDMKETTRAWFMLLWRERPGLWLVSSECGFDSSHFSGQSGRR